MDRDQGQALATADGSSFPAAQGLFRRETANRPKETYNNVGHGWVDSKADGFRLPAPAGPYDPTKPDSALRRAEAKFDEDQLMDKVAKHCNSISARLDACEDRMVRNGGRDE